ncbi:LysR family transcriptional regulator [Gemmatimonadetes bacterium T265]|nr:LysR family transcriptional regulator [Gemmatimonadetes bacterium T265]
MALNLHALRVFAAVAERGGFSRAATVLRLSQPAVSKAVLGLEREIGLPLLERGARAARLTDAGEALYQRARELFAVERTAEDELRARRGLDAGVLRLGASTTVATYYLAPLLGAFRAAHPGVTLRVASANTRAIARLLLQRRLDVALVEGPVTDPGVRAATWREDELVVLAPPEHALGRTRRSVAPAALGEHPFIARERGSGTRVVAEAALAAHGVRPRVALTLGSTEAVKEAVAAGLGLAIVSRTAAADQLALARVRAVRVAGLVIRRPLTQLRLEGRRPSAPAVAFEALLAADVGPSAAPRAGQSRRPADPRRAD